MNVGNSRVSKYSPRWNAAQAGTPCRVWATSGLAVWTRAALICFGCSGSLPVDPLAALGIFPRAGSVLERLAPFVVGKFALHRRAAPEQQRRQQECQFQNHGNLAPEKTAPGAEG
jgi:hypothetical protein